MQRTRCIYHHRHCIQHSSLNILYTRLNLFYTCLSHSLLPHTAHFFLVFHRGKHIRRLSKRKASYIGDKSRSRLCKIHTYLYKVYKCHQISSIHLLSILISLDYHLRSILNQESNQILSHIFHTHLFRQHKKRNSQDTHNNSYHT